MGTRLTIRTPADFELARDVCSYGYFILAPNHWDVSLRTLTTGLHLDDGPARVTVSEKSGGLRAVFDRTLSRAEQAGARAMLSRMLRLEESGEFVRRFHEVDPRWRARGRARLFRSATLFEDVVKTVTSCNVAWPSTVRMNERLCVVLGGKTPSGWFSFPTASKVARTRAGTLRGRCGVGYRDQRIIDLARMFSRGEIDEAWLEDPGTSDEDVFGYLKTLPGIGPYAAGNIMQLLGRYSRLALDTESVRHGRAVLGYEGTDRELMKRLAAHYEPFGAFRFLSYWFEVWEFYERKRGPAETWDRETTGRTFTAALLKD